MPILLLLLSFISCANAEPYGQGKIVHYDESNRGIEKKVELMHKKMNLSPNQQAAVQTALTDQLTKFDLLQKEVQEARKKITDDTDGALIGILNPQQQEIYQKMKTDILGKTEMPANEDKSRTSGRRDRD